MKVQDLSNLLMLPILGTTKPHVYISNASLDDEDCAGIGDWDDDDANGGASAQAAFDGESTFEMAGGNNQPAAQVAARSKDVGSLEGENTLVFSLQLYHDSLGTTANTDYFSFRAHRSDWYFRADYGTDGLFIYKAAGTTEVGTNIVVQDAWQAWTFVVDLSGGVGSATVRTYLENVPQGTVDCDKEAASVDGDIYLQQYGYTTDGLVTYVDYVKIGNGLA